MSNESDNDMKELYRNEILSLGAEISAYDKELEEEFYEYRNNDIEEVLVEIRAGKISSFSFLMPIFRCWWGRGCFIRQRTM